MGVGGVGMAGLAFLLKKRGYDVSGCDKYATPRTRWLEEAGIPFHLGHSPDHLPDAQTLVVTPAVPSSEQELAQARACGMTIRYRGELLAELVNAADGIAVCGTHGKTTTATFTAKLLRLLGDDPSWCIGGETGEMPVAGIPTHTDRPPESTPLVVEADESDGTLARYHAHTLVVTSMDYDHPEHFKTIEAYRACFAQAEAQAQEVIHAWELDASDWPQLPNLVLGAHNVSNARAAIEVALRRGHTREAIATVLPEALAVLPDRRFQVLWPQTNDDSITIVTDYAHHPAELACAVGMAKALNPKRLRVLFQPHRYSRTKSLKEQFPMAFTAADEMVLIPVYPAFEAPILGGDIADLYLSFRQMQMGQQDAPAHDPAKRLWPQGLRLARSAAEAWKHVYLTRQPGDLILLAGAGDIINLVPQVLADMGTDPAQVGRQMGTDPICNESNRQITTINLSKFSFFRTGGVSYGGGTPYVVGMGSNTWFSDCATDLTLQHAPATMGTAPFKVGTVPNRKGTVPAGMVGARLLAEDSTWRGSLAFMAGIPGTLGGWVKMNAGAFGHSISEMIASVTIQDDTGTLRELAAEACGFGYRTSNIPGLIVAITLRPDALQTESRPADYLSRRKNFPPRTCGSVFKNPSLGNPAGALLEEAGAKSLRVGGASVWSEHANVIVAEEGATSSDILALARLMAALVRHKFDIMLEPEIRGLEVT